MVSSDDENGGILRLVDCACLELNTQISETIIYIFNRYITARRYYNQYGYVLP